MYRILIVDDEQLITDALYDVIRQLMPDELDVYKAYSGKEALEWMERTRIDIILTDISMPGISGLELVEQIQELWPRCKVIFLTGYDHFDYVYQAIQMKDVRYILKTEGYDKITETVNELVEELKNESSDSQAPELTSEEKYAYELMEQSQFMRDILHDSKIFSDDQDQLREEFQGLNIPLDTAKSVFLVLGHWEYPKKKSYTERSRVLNYVRASWNRRFSKQIKSSSIVDRYGDVVWFIQTTDDKNWDSERLIDFLEGTLEIIQEDCSNTFGLNVQFTISSQLIEWPFITEKYSELRQLQQLKIDYSHPQIIKGIDQDQIRSRQVFNQTAKMDVLAAHVTTGRKTEFFTEFYEIIEGIEESTYHEVLEQYFIIALVLFVDISHNDLEDQINDFNKLLRIDEHPTLSDGFDYLEQVAKQLFSLKETEEEERATKVIDRISHYIEHHLHEDLSLVRLAEMYYFNPSYLSHLFKQEKGINLSEFIDQARTKRAKKLLLDPDLKIREISEQLNYHSAHSFTRFFKKMTGLTPKEYRDSL